MSRSPGPDLSLRQIPQVRLTPRLQQSIRFLEMPQLELREHLEGLLLENPLLEEEFSPLEEESPSSEDVKEPSGEDQAEEREDWESFQAVQPESLYSFLLFQLRLHLSDDLDLAIGEEIIGNLNEDGYFLEDTRRLADTYQTAVETVEKILAVVQSLEPTGIGARNLSECLLLQLGEGGGRLTKKIIQESLDEIQDGRNWIKLAKRLGCRREDLLESMEEIRMLDPRPACNYTQQTTVYIQPDLIVRRRDKQFRLELNHSVLPRVTVSPAYQKLMQDPAAREFLRGKLSAARWVVHCMEKRQQTLLRVGEFLISWQQPFLQDGILRLRPLSLQEMATHLHLHPSTLSRTLKGKSIETPRGIFPLKYLVPSGFGEKTERVSSMQVKEEMRRLIATEDRKLPYSDTQIVHLMEKQGIFLARRTVVKYREALGIPSRAQRRERGGHYVENRN
jgi:RNA polymerase sigma-54 factor